MSTYIVLLLVKNTTFPTANPDWSCEAVSRIFVVAG